MHHLSTVRRLALTSPRFQRSVLVSSWEWEVLCS